MTSETAAEDRSRGWSARQTLAAVAVAAAIGGIGGAAIYAGTQGSPHFPGGAPHSQGPMHGTPPPQGAPPLAPPGPADAGTLHSEYVVSDGNGGFITKLVQTGTIDEVTPSNIVVRSDDGYTQIYAYPSGASNGSVAANDKVTVTATRTGATVTMNSIGETPPPAS